MCLTRRPACLAAFVLMAGMLAACEDTTATVPPTTAGPTGAVVAGASSEAMQFRETPAMRWGQRKNGDAWTREVLAALDRDGVRLTHTVPADIQTYCPAFASAEPPQRKAFWAGFLSALAKHESTWNPQAKGGGGKWLGLMQISPATWRGYGCKGDILDGGDNLSCAVKIMNTQVGRDGVVAGGGTHGVGRDWAPMRSAVKRADIASWTSQQAYCQG